MKHAELEEMIRLYIEEDLSYEKIAEQLNRSSRTPLLHVKKHNKNIERNGVCPICKKMKSGFEMLLVDKG
jgi:predicted DNA-binding protein YlxM (UPF0122 family)